MKKLSASFITTIFETLMYSLMLAVPLSYFLVRFYLRLQDPVEAFLTVIVLTFLLGFIRKPGTLTYNLYRSVIVFLLSMVFASAITAFVLVYPFTVFEFNLLQVYPVLFIKILTWPFGYFFFSVGVAFMLIGDALAAVTRREAKHISSFVKW